MACGGCAKARKRMQAMIKAQEDIKGAELSRGEKRKIRIEARKARIARRNARIHAKNKALGK